MSKTITTACNLKTVVAAHAGNRKLVPLRHLWDNHNLTLLHVEHSAQYREPLGTWVSPANAPVRRLPNGFVHQRAILTKRESEPTPALP